MSSSAMVWLMFGEIEEGIVAEAVVPRGAVRICAFDGAGGDGEDLAIAGGGEDAAVAGVRRLRECRRGAEEVEVVACRR